jgi:hypothetical protein
VKIEHMRTWGQRYDIPGITTYMEVIGCFIDVPSPVTVTTNAVPMQTVEAVRRQVSPALVTESPR